MSETDSVTLTVNGKVYAGWTEIRVSRGIDRMSSDFKIAVTEAWADNAQPWQIVPLNACTISIGKDLVLTGYVDAYAPQIDGTEHTVRIEGRSKTEDLIDCSPDIASGQFKGYKLSQIARSICNLFMIDVVATVDDPQVFPDATIQRCETAYEFLERLARMSAVLLTDDEQGRLVLSRTGTTRAAGRLQQGVNIEAARGDANVRKRFSVYIVKGQSAISDTESTVQTSQVASAVDAGVSRYRPRVTIAESQLDARGMQQRATWERNYAYGRSIKAVVTVPGWRQPDGSLWRINQLVSCTIPSLELDQDLLVVTVTFLLDAHRGRRTELTVGPIEGYTPDPGQVKHRKQKGDKGGAMNLSGLGGIP